MQYVRTEDGTVHDDAADHRRGDSPGLVRNPIYVRHDSNQPVVACKIRIVTYRNDPFDSIFRYLVNDRNVRTVVELYKGLHRDRERDGECET